MNSLPLKRPAEAANKPNFVSGAGYPGPGQRSFIFGFRYRKPLATYPGAQAGNPQTLPYLVLHQVGFTKLPRSPEALVRSYRTVSPLPGRTFTVIPGGLLSVALSFTLP
jgi:hypothetical protein